MADPDDIGTAGACTSAGTSMDAVAAANVHTACHHMALVAIDGATDEVALTLATSFRLHLDRAVTDRWGYLALIDANVAVHGPRPPLDVLRASGSGQFVTLAVEPRCLIHMRIAAGLIAEMWMTTDWGRWTAGLGDDLLP